jgi:RNA polymerase sigma factor (sigma-70 family)
VNQEMNDPEELLKHSRWLRGLARSLVGDAQTADDLVQDTWVAALRNPYQHEARPWLRRVLRNFARQRSREGGRRLRREREVAREGLLPSAEELATRMELQKAMVELVMALDQPYRSTVILRYYEGLSAAEIGRRKGIPGATVRSHLKRGLDELRRRLDERHEGDREAWSALLIPWFIPKPSVATGAAAAATALINGVTIMSTGSKLFLGVAAVALALVGYQLFDGGKPLDTEAAVGDVDVPVDAFEIARPATASAPVGSPGGVAQTRVEVESAELGALPADELACRIVGLVLDVDGTPLPGVVVRLMGSEAWPKEVESTYFDERLELSGFGTETGDRGAFRIDAPVPTKKSWTYFEILPDAYHETYQFNFDPSLAGGGPSLTEGVRDLGEIRLAATGALRGRVTDEQGEPVAGVEMDIGPRRNVAFRGLSLRATRTDAYGEFLMGHAPVGAYVLKAKAEGYTIGYREPVTVKAGRDTTGMDFVLATAPTIEGIIVEEDGTPIVGAHVHGRPWSAGAGAGANSDADGRFVMVLPQAESYMLAATCDGYESWGNLRVRSQPVKPGTRNVEIVMRSMPRMRFIVVDGETGDCLEHFALAILEGTDSGLRPLGRARRGSRVRGKSPGGVAEVAARPGVDRYEIVVRGYVMATGEVICDVEGKPLQTVRMQRGASLTGRVLRDGDPVAGARVAIQPTSGISRGVVVANDGVLPVVNTDVSGRFEMTALPMDEYSVTIRPPEGVTLVVSTPMIRGTEDRDLGDLVLPRGAHITGTAMLPPGVDPAGLEVQLGTWMDGVKALVAASGSFHFDEIAPGAHRLTLCGRPGVLAACDPVEVELRADETLSVTIDARDRAVCAVTLGVEMTDFDVLGVQVDLVSTEDPKSRTSLGRCDEAGRVVGFARAWGGTKVVALVPGVGFTEHPDARLNLTPNGQVESTLRFEFASLSVRLSEGVKLPVNGYVRFILRHPDSDRPARSLFLKFVDGAATGTAPVRLEIEDGRFVIHGQTPGLYEFQLEYAEDPKTSEVSFLRERTVHFQDGTVFEEQTPYYSVTREVRLDSTKTVEPQLE